MGACELIFCASVLAFGVYRLRFGVDALRTLAFLAIVFGNQATTYTNRTRQRLWSPPPSRWVVLSSGADILLASALAIAGIAMARLPVLVVIATFAAAATFAVGLDWLKVPVFRRLTIA
jgi:H+-transporting ATPase